MVAWCFSRKVKMYRNEGREKKMREGREKKCQKRGKEEENVRTEKGKRGEC